MWTDPEGYYFCNIVTVLPDQQGKGIGKLLFQHITDRADAEGRKCYLESSRDKPNTEIYEKLGFRKVKEMVCDDEGDACQVSCKALLRGFVSLLHSFIV
jgi:GNAT superfamily N-acetyltransferase